MPVNTAVRAVVRSPNKAVPLGVLCLRVGAFTVFFFSGSLRAWVIPSELLVLSVEVCRSHVTEHEFGSALLGFKNVYLCESK